MKNTILLFPLVLLLACESSDKQNTGITEKATETKKTNIDKLDSRQEGRQDGEFNQMTLFSVDSTAGIEDLKRFCSEKKSEYSDGYFQILVFFKNREASRFPDNPVTGGFMEETDLRNIKAIYTINNSNGFSKLDYYESNALESKANTVDID
jgi:hypothetical protein